ncbi:MAG: hypothetical protein ACK5QN_01480 [Burkholderiales bacterium]|jgi:hypothetical protein
MKPIKALPSRKRDKVAFPAAAVPAVPGPAKPKMSIKEHYRSLLLGLIKAPFLILFGMGKFTLVLTFHLTRILIRQ